ncbi:MAG: cupin domain-containing protein [Bacteroidota bacterium]
MYQKPLHTGNAAKLPLPQDAWLLYKFDNHEIIRLDLKTGEAIDNHVNEWRIVFYVLEGEGTLNVEGKEHHLSSSQTIAVEAGLNRYWKNTGVKTLRLMVIKTRESQVQ